MDLLEVFIQPNNASTRSSSFHTLPVGVCSENEPLIMFLSAVIEHTFAKFFFDPDPTIGSFFLTS